MRKEETSGELEQEKYLGHGQRAPRPQQSRRPGRQRATVSWCRLDLFSRCLKVEWGHLWKRKGRIRTPVFQASPWNSLKERRGTKNMLYSGEDSPVPS